MLASAGRLPPTLPPAGILAAAAISPQTWALSSFIDPVSSYKGAGPGSPESIFAPCGREIGASAVLPWHALPRGGGVQALLPVGTGAGKIPLSLGS